MSNSLKVLSRIVLRRSYAGVEVFTRFMATVSDEKLEFYKKWFEQLDADKDGYITQEEFTTGLNNIHKISESKKEVAAFMKRMDTDNSGIVGFEEFLNYLAAQPEVEYTEDTIEKTFKIFDKDKDGLVSKEELVQAFRSMGQDIDDATVDAMIEQYDKDGDGLISAEEFKVFLLSKPDAK